MAIYKYLGRNQTGVKVGGTIEANASNEVAAYLSERGITILHIEKITTKGKSINAFIEGFFGIKAKPKEVLVFARQMAVLTSAGVSLIRAVRQLSVSARVPGMKKALNGVADGIEAGQGLAVAMRSYPKVFSPIFIGVIEVGENTGHLDEAFTQLASFLEKKIANHRRLIAAIRYPSLVLISIAAAIVIMNIFVVPKFSALFKSFKAELPLATRMLINTSDFMTQHWLLMFGIIFVLIVGGYYLLRIKKVKYFWDKYKLRLPVVGVIQRRVILAQFSWTFSMIISSGVPVLRAIVLASGVTDNVYISGQLFGIRDAVDQGESFSRATSFSGVFDTNALQMIEVGEETGKLDDMFSKISSAYEDEVDYDIKNLNDILEPVILAALGALVAILALAIYLPMWEMIQVAKF